MIDEDSVRHLLVLLHQLRHRRSSLRCRCVWSQARSWKEIKAGRRNGHLYCIEHRCFVGKLLDADLAETEDIMRKIQPQEQRQAAQNSRDYDSLHRCFSFYRLLWGPGPGSYSLLKYPMRSSTALTINGSATVASSKTSANRPPSSGGTNLPQETASV